MIDWEILACLNGLGIVTKEQGLTERRDLQRRSNLKLTYCFKFPSLFFCYETLSMSL